MPRTRDRITETDQDPDTASIIQYIEGYAWGIAIDGRTVCLGETEAIKAAIANPKLKSGYPDIDQIISLERDILKEIDNGKPNIQRPGAFRSRSAREIKHRTANIRQAKTRKRLTLR